MLLVLTARELRDWWHVYQIRPFGERANDIRCAHLAMCLLRPHVAKGTELKRTDFMPFVFEVKEPEEPKSLDDQAKEALGYGRQ